MANRAAAVSPAPGPLTSYKSRVVGLRALASQQRNLSRLLHFQKNKSNKKHLCQFGKVKKDLIKPDNEPLSEGMLPKQQKRRM